MHAYRVSKKIAALAKYAKNNENSQLLDESSSIKTTPNAVGMGVLAVLAITLL